MTGNVINMATGVSLKDEDEQEAALQQKFDQAVAESITPHKEAMMEAALALIERIESGDIDSFCLLGKSSKGDFLMPSIFVNEQTATSNDYAIFSNGLAIMSADTRELSKDGPVMTLSGHLVVFPTDEEEYYEE